MGLQTMEVTDHRLLHVHVACQWVHLEGVRKERMDVHGVQPFLVSSTLLDDFETRPEKINKNQLKHSGNVFLYRVHCVKLLCSFVRFYQGSFFEMTSCSNGGGEQTRLTSSNMTGLMINGCLRGGEKERLPRLPTTSYSLPEHNSSF